MARRRRTWALAALGLLPVGCETTGGALLVGPPADPPAFVARVDDAGVLTLPRLIELTYQNNPDLTVARARVEAARGRLIQAGLYPNPTFEWEGEDIGSQGNGAAGKQGPIISQTVVTAGKLKRAKAAAAQGVVLADWQAASRWYEAATRTRLAYYEALAAQREIKTAEDAVKLGREGLDAAQKLQKAGAGTQPDLIRATVELNQGQVQFEVANERHRAARQLLAVAVGMPDLPCGPLAETLELPPPDYDWHTIVDVMLARSSPMQEAHTAVLQAEEQLQLARAQKCPDVTLRARPIYVFPDHRAEVNVWVGAALPLYNRNQGNILAAEADLGRAREEVRQAELRLMERLTLAYQRYLSARHQADGYRRNILPSARESLRLVRLGYERGDARYDYTTVLTAQRTLVQAEAVYVQALRELWRAVADIDGLLQTEDGCLTGGPPLPDRDGSRPVGAGTPKPE